MKTLHKTIRVGVASTLIMGLGSGDALFAMPTGGAKAQTIDASDTVGTQVTESGGSFAITGGQLRENNLFHSFTTFSPGDRNTFFDLQDSTYDAVSNIFGRVTGTTSTYLNGDLSILGGDSPNLFLLNPNGILIGPNANLDIPGSLFLTTAESVSFQDGTVFSTGDRTPSPLLTISAPTGLYLGADAAPIAVNGRFPGPSTEGYNPADISLFPSSVTLLGNGIDFNQAFFSAPSGQIQLSSVGNNSQVSIAPDSHVLSYAADTAFSNIQLTQSILLTNSAVEGFTTFSSGRLSLHGHHIDINSSDLYSENFSAEKGGAINLSASNLIEIEDSLITTSVFPGFVPSTGAGGDIFITAEALRVLPTSEIISDTYSVGAGGNIFVEANRVSLFADERSPGAFESPDVWIASNTFSEGEGGSVTINASDSLEIVGGVAITAVTSYADATAVGVPGVQSGQGGNITLDVGDLTLEDGVQLRTTSYSDAAAGNISIVADDILLSEQNDYDIVSGLRTVTIDASAFAEGPGGNLSITADTLKATGAVGIIAASGALLGPELAYGDAGNLTLVLGQLTLEEGAQVATGTFSDGDAGDLTIHAAEGIDISGATFLTQPDGQDRVFPSGLFISSEPGSSGNGGNLSLTTPRLSVTAGGSVSARTAGDGNAGNIDIRAGEIAVADPIIDPLDGTVSGISATVSRIASGDGGQLDIVSDRIHLYNGGQITASTEGAGNAGDVNVRAAIVDIEGTSADGRFSSAISSRSTTAFDAGSVNVRGDRINIRDRGMISVSSTDGGNAGNVNLSANQVYLNRASIRADSAVGVQGNLVIESQESLLLRNNSQLTTNATQLATGGNITLNSPVIVGLENSDISANAVEGDGGNIQLTTQGLIGLRFRDRLTPANDITASSEFGINGTVQIETPEVDPDDGLVRLPDNLADSSSQIAARCTASEVNRFVSSGRGGTPTNPTQLLGGESIWQDFRGLDGVGTGLGAVGDRTPANSTSVLAISEMPAIIETPRGIETDTAQARQPLQEASQWKINQQGQVVLAAASSVVTPVADCLTSANTNG